MQPSAVGRDLSRCSKRPRHSSWQITPKKTAS